MRITEVLLRKMIKEALERESGTATRRAIVYPNFQGADFADEVSGPEMMLPVKDCIGNEPSKDLTYFNTEKRAYVQKIIASARREGAEAFPPIKALPHPLLSEKWIVIDGNHRLGAFKIGGIGSIKAQVIDEGDVLLAVPEDVGWQQGVVPETVPLTRAAEAGLDLSKYFSTQKLVTRRLRD